MATLVSNRSAEARQSRTPTSTTPPRKVKVESFLLALLMRFRLPTAVECTDELTEASTLSLVVCFCKSSYDNDKKGGS